MTIETELQKPNIGALIELYDLDMTMFGEGHLYFTPHTVNGTSNVSFGSQVYLPMPIQAEGFTVGIGGASPRPVLKISNISRFIQSYLIAHDDLVGAYITRTITLEKFLDSGSSPDDTQILSQTKYVIQQKTKLNKFEVQFTLSSLLDSPNFKLPRGIVLRSEFPAAGLFRKQ